jgi:adenylate kinase
MKTELIFLGAPASGKGTQTKKLSKALGLPHVDTGSMLRAEIAKGSEEGLTAKGFMDKGTLVPIEIVAAIIKKRLNEDDCKNGFILDGYPRSTEQAVALEKVFSEINENIEFSLKVINIDVNENLLIERIVTRRLCKDCGKIFNTKYMAPKKDGICDDCGSELYQRQDDTEEIAKNRLDTYKEQTQPLIKFYSDKNLLLNVDGNNTVDDIYNSIISIIK